MKFMERLKFMFSRSRDEQPNPDPIRGDVVRAVQANETAAIRAQKALEDMLDSGRMRHDIGRIMGAGKRK